MQTEIERARAALACIPADLPREQWARVGMAVKAAGLTFEDFDAWSQQGASYRTADARDTWRSIKADGGVTAATLHYIAREHGYSDSMKPRQGLKSAAGALPKREHTQAPAMSPAAVWGRCEPATWEHAYIARKGAAGVPLAALRVVPEGDALRIAGQSVVGWLVVPARGADGELQSLQFVPPGAGKKLNLPGASMAGARHIVGEPQEGRPLYLVEGIGQAWACWQATGRRAVVCFGWGNVGRVAAQLREREPTAALVLVPDTGKEADADKLARELQCAVAKLPEGEPANFDANDYARREGGDALAALLEGATEPPKPEPLLKPVDVAGVIANPSPPPRFVWEGYCPRGEVTLLGAHGGTGKSTIGEMLAVAVVSRSRCTGPMVGCPTLPTHRQRACWCSVRKPVPTIRPPLRCCACWLSSKAGGNTQAPTLPRATTRTPCCAANQHSRPWA